jgi:hypothetical protein
VRRFRKAGLVTALAVAAMLLLGTAAQAVLTVRRGTIADQHIKVHQTNPFTIAAAAYTDVPTAEATVTIPAGQQRMLDARFSAESQCVGAAGWCSVRIVVVRPGGLVQELDPVSGTDFAFDSPDPGADQFESHAMERSTPFLPAGTYRVRVQGAVVAGATQLRLDDWSLVVEAVRP